MVSIFFIILIGIRNVSYFDIEKEYVVLDFYIFKRILILKIKFFKCAEKIYYQINKHEIKQIENKGNKSLSNTKEKKYSFFKLYFRKLYLNIGYPINEGADIVFIFACIKNLIDIAIKLIDDYLDIKDYKVESVAIAGENYKFNMEFEIGLGLYKMFFEYLKTNVL